MSVKIYNTKNARENGVKVLVYGKGGIGKTTLMGTAPRPFIISCESGMLALKDVDVPYTKISNIDELDEVYEFIVSGKGKRYKTICLDSISEMGELCLAEIKTSVNDGRQAYGELADTMQEKIRMFRDIEGKNVVFSATQKRIEDSDSGLTQYVPGMPGNTLTQSMPYFFDEVFYMTLYEKSDGKAVRVLKTQTSFEHDAKDRSGELKKIELPNLTKIFNKILKGK